MLDEGVIVEIVRPGTGDPVPDGEVGEVVVTTLNPDYPLIRFGTGDLSAVLPGALPDRPHATRASRAGSAAPTRRPRCAACSCTRARSPRSRAAIPRCARARLVVERRDGERPHDAAGRGATARAEGLAERIAETMRDVTKLRGEVELCAPGSLPNDGKVIEDARSYT